MIFGLSACSGSASYSPEKCRALIEKTKSGDKLTESDYNEMIDQYGAAVKVLAEKQKAVGDDKEALKELKNNDEVKELLETALGFGIYLSLHEKDLSQDNIKRYNNVNKELKALDKDSK